MSRPLSSSRRRLRTCCVVVVVLAACCRWGEASPPEADAASIAALEQSLGWLETHPPDPSTDSLGNLTLDVMALHAFAHLHPDEKIRLRAGGELDRRLRALPGPAEPSMVALSYWATLLRLMAIRGLDLERHRSALAGWDLDALVAEAMPHTVCWIDGLLHRVGLRDEPDLSRTLLATGPAVASEDYRPSITDAYRMFHELIPRTDFGREPIERLEPQERRFARRVLPGLIEVGRADGNTDAVAEALVCSAMLGLSETAAHRDAMSWVLSRSRGDGTFFSRRDAGRDLAPEAYRHVVLTASWAVLATIRYGDGSQE